MAVNPEWQQVDTSYISDDGNVYSLVQRRNHAEANGSTSSGGQPPYPRKWKPRCIHGKSDDGIQKAVLVIPDPGHILFTQNGGTFNIPNLGTFNKTGSTGEKRPKGAPPL